ncbi:unnamed protein product [Prorocentrum cordatum]|uniref:Uncharacterized protein n=1 Tax=Prorocentrum cordatum TaxID=2364126 RepID=A0ABN9PC29_9DINO|nr:unnamed protein product [Polarella glacialis]
MGLRAAQAVEVDFVTEQGETLTARLRQGRLDAYGGEQFDIVTALPEPTGMTPDAAALWQDSAGAQEELRILGGGGVAVPELCRERGLGRAQVERALVRGERFRVRIRAPAQEGAAAEARARGCDAAVGLAPRGSGPLGVANGSAAVFSGSLLTDAGPHAEQDLLTVLTELRRGVGGEPPRPSVLFLGLGFLLGRELSLDTVAHRRPPRRPSAALGGQEAEELAIQAEVEAHPGGPIGTAGSAGIIADPTTTLPPVPEHHLPSAGGSHAGTAAPPAPQKEAPPPKVQPLASVADGEEHPVVPAATTTPPARRAARHQKIASEHATRDSKEPWRAADAAQVARAARTAEALQAESAAVREIVREASFGSKEQMKSVSEMFGDIKRDMYRMNEKIGSLQRDIEDGVKIAPPDPADSLVYPLSACTRCILVLTVLYFVLYTLVSVYSLVLEFLDILDGGLAEQALRAACDAVLHAPMLCVLFLGAQLRALQVTRGEHGPQEVAELAMEACTWSVVVQTALVLLIPLLTGEVPKVDDGNRVEIPDLDSQPLAGLLTLVRFAAMTCLYLGCCVICISVVLMDARSLGAEPTFHHAS